MIMNKNMKALLEEYSIDIADSIQANNTYPVWCKADAAGRAYWGISSFWELDKRPIHADQDLSQLEWDGNEVNLDAHSEKEIPNILRQAIGIVAFWRSELETKYPETPFYIIASYDNGNMLILDEGELPAQSVTLRFWADRGSNTVVCLEDFENWDQPAIMECCNFVSTNIACTP